MNSLRQYKSHKTVHAARITSYSIPDANGITTVFFGDDRHAKLPQSRFGGQRPSDGYYVLYEDGYESWSPIEAFESGYTIVGREEDRALAQTMWDKFCAMADAGAFCTYTNGQQSLTCNEDRSEVDIDIMQVRSEAMKRAIESLKPNTGEVMLSMTQLVERARLIEEFLTEPRNTGGTPVQ